MRIGDTFPELTARDLEGNPVTLDAGMRGERYTLLVFWSTWCGFCMLELPHEIELSRQYEPLGLRVIGINADETAEEARRAVLAQQLLLLDIEAQRLSTDITLIKALGVGYRGQ